MGRLYKILKWVETEGEPQAVARLRMMVLKPAVAAGVNLFAVQPTTDAPAGFINELQSAAGKVVGRPCPC